MKGALGLALTLLAATAVHAQPPDPSLNEARELFRDGLTAMEQGRVADALRAFERSYDLAPNAATLFNVATTLRALGRHRDARDTFDRLLAAPSLPEDLRTRATEMRRETAARVAVLSLAGLPAATPALVLHLDGEPHDDD